MGEDLSRAVALVAYLRACAEGTNEPSLPTQLDDTILCPLVALCDRAVAAYARQDAVAAAAAVELACEHLWTSPISRFAAGLWPEDILAETRSIGLRTWYEACVGLVAAEIMHATPAGRGQWPVDRWHGTEIGQSIIVTPGDGEQPARLWIPKQVRYCLALRTRVRLDGQFPNEDDLLPERTVCTTPEARIEDWIRWLGDDAEPVEARIVVAGLWCHIDAWGIDAGAQHAQPLVRAIRERPYAAWGRVVAKPDDPLLPTTNRSLPATTARTGVVAIGGRLSIVDAARRLRNAAEEAVERLRYGQDVDQIRRLLWNNASHHQQVLAGNATRSLNQVLAEILRGLIDAACSSWISRGDRSRVGEGLYLAQMEGRPDRYWIAWWIPHDATDDHSPIAMVDASVVPAALSALLLIPPTDRLTGGVMPIEELVGRGWATILADAVLSGGWWEATDATLGSISRWWLSIPTPRLTMPATPVRRAGLRKLARDEIQALIGITPKPEAIVDQVGQDH